MADRKLGKILACIFLTLKYFCAFCFVFLAVWAIRRGQRGGETAEKRGTKHHINTFSHSFSLLSYYNFILILCSFINFFCLFAYSLISVFPHWIVKKIKEEGKIHRKCIKCKLVLHSLVLN